MLKTLALTAALITIGLAQGGCTHNKANAQAKAEARTAAKTTDAADADGDIICKEIGETAGRLKKKKVCRTKQEWAQIEKDSKRFLTDVDRRGATQPGGESLTPGG